MRAVDDLAYGVFRSSAFVCRLLPAAIVRRLWLAAAWFAGDVLRLRRAVVDRQLAACLPGHSASERARIARGVYRHLALTVAELLRPSPAAVVPAVRIDPGWGPLDRALAAGRGVIVASAHLGNFELGGRVLASRYPLLDVVKPLHNKRFDHWIHAVRERHGIRTVAAEGAAAAVLAHLRGGGLVSLVLDQDAGAAGVRIRFLGHEAAAWSGAARFSLQTGCPVVPMGIIRQPDGTHVLHVGRALGPEGRAGDEEGIRAYTAEISGAVEGYIRLAPAQWFWVHRRWKEAEKIPPARGLPRARPGPA